MNNQRVVHISTVSTILTLRYVPSTSARQRRRLSEAELDYAVLLRHHMMGDFRCKAAFERNPSCGAEAVRNATIRRQDI
jgi:hypothetical protein